MTFTTLNREGQEAGLRVYEREMFVVKQDEIGEICKTRQMSKVDSDP